MYFEHVSSLLPHRCRVTCGLEGVQEGPAGAASLDQTACLLLAWLLTLILMHTPMLMGWWECRHPRLTLHIILILTIQASMACTPCTASREVWGLIPLSPVLSLTTSLQAWWHCAWKPKTLAASCLGQRDWYLIRTEQVYNQRIHTEIQALAFWTESIFHQARQTVSVLILYWICSWCNSNNKNKCHLYTCMLFICFHMGACHWLLSIFLKYFKNLF